MSIVCSNTVFSFVFVKYANNTTVTTWFENHHQIKYKYLIDITVSSS